MSSAEPLVAQRFAAGATDATRRYALKQNGAAFDLTGYTAVKLYARLPGDTPVIVSPITGTVISASGGTVDFDHTSIAALAGTYTCDIETTSATAKLGYSEETFQIVVRPRAATVTT